MVDCIKCGIETDITIDELCPVCSKIKSINDKSIRKWIVFWFNGERIGSVELNEFNRKEIEKELIYDIIQIDITGTTHLNVLGIKKTNKPNKANGSK